MLQNYKSQYIFRSSIEHRIGGAFKEPTAPIEPCSHHGYKRHRYPGSASSTPLIQLSTPESVVSAWLRKPGQGFSWGQQWSASVGHVQGVGFGRDKLEIRAQSSRVLESL
uniref:Late blight resistance protein n=1 Tax=Solanum tuberosum TaxID=4113 RepID=M1DIW1_SOLTU